MLRQTVALLGLERLHENSAVQFVYVCVRERARVCECARVRVLATGGGARQPAPDAAVTQL